MQIHLLSTMIAPSLKHHNWATPQVNTELLQTSEHNHFNLGIPQDVCSQVSRAKQVPWQWLVLGAVRSRGKHKPTLSTPKPLWRRARHRRLCRRHPHPQRPHAATPCVGHTLHASHCLPLLRSIHVMSRAALPSRSQRHSVFHAFLLILPQGVCRGKTAARGKLRHSAMGQRSMGNWARQKAVRA